MRRHYLDNLRWATVCLVVVYHVFYMYNGVITDGVLGPFARPQYQDALQYLLYPWFMVLLFLVAGMCSRYYLEAHTVGEFVRSRTRKLLVPSTVGLLAVGWVQGYVSMAISDAFRTIPDTVPAIAMYFIMVLSGTGVLWFAQLLWLFSMLLAAVRRFETGRLYGLTRGASLAVLVLLAVPVYLSGLVLNTPVIAVYRFGIYGFTFFLGYFLFAHDEVVERLSRYALPLLAAAAVLGCVYLLLHFGDNYAVMPVVNCVPAAAYAWAACLAALGGMKRWGDTQTRLSAWMSERSFGLYVLHYLPLSATAYALHQYAPLPALPSYLIVALAAFGGSLILYEIISRAPFLRWCVLGLGRGKPHV